MIECILLFVCILLFLFFWRTFFFRYLFIYLFWPCRVSVATHGIFVATCGLSCGMHMGSISPAKDRTQAPCIGSVESYPLEPPGKSLSGELWLIYLPIGILNSWYICIYIYISNIKNRYVDIDIIYRYMKRFIIRSWFTWLWRLASLKLQSGPADWRPRKTDGAEEVWRQFSELEEGASFCSLHVFKWLDEAYLHWRQSAVHYWLKC